MCSRNHHGGLPNPLIKIQEWTLEDFKNNDPDSLIQPGEYCTELQTINDGKKVWWPNPFSSNTVSTGGEFSFPLGSTTVKTRLTIPANFRKGMVIVGLESLQLNFSQKGTAMFGNWMAYPNPSLKPKYPGAISCGKYPSCTQYYSVLQNGQK
jgi:hypothetical protein